MTDIADRLDELFKSELCDIDVQSARILANEAAAEIRRLRRRLCEWTDGPHEVYDNRSGVLRVWMVCQHGADDCRCCVDHYRADSDRTPTGRAPETAEKT